MENVKNVKFGFDGAFRKENFLFKINVGDSVVVKSSHKGSPTGDIAPIQQGTDNNTGLAVAVYRVSDDSAHTYEITDGNDSLVFKIQRGKIVWL